MGKTQKSAKVIAVSSRKGGVGKTTTSVSLAAGLAQKGRKVLLIDCDSQHSATISLGIREPESLTATLASIMKHIVSDEAFDPLCGIIRHSEGMDVMPSNNALSGTELDLVQAMGRETVLSRYIGMVKTNYEYVIIDCAPSLGLLTLNALACADSVVIPITPRYLDAKGMESLLKTVAQVKRHINPALSIEGILLTMADRRAGFTREIISLIESTYGGRARIFAQPIPRSVRVSEASASGASIFAHDPKGKAALAYAGFVGEVLANA